ncbi:MAG: sodium ion-translocating decarboxylase subunit beta [Comamonadaceae bacterium]|nr:sodium ion-translocating decarboxylase subunit beta [Comamonadaceae bacterium]
MLVKAGDAVEGGQAADHASSDAPAASPWKPSTCSTSSRASPRWRRRSRRSSAAASSSSLLGFALIYLGRASVLEPLLMIPMGLRHGGGQCRRDVPGGRQRRHAVRRPAAVGSGRAR